MADVTFRRGVEANLPTSGMAVEGCVYQSTDTGNMYVGSTKGTLIPVNRSPYYGTCATAAGTNAKVVTLDVDDDNFTMKAGVMVSVLFAYNNTASSPTLNVNRKGAVAIKAYGTTNVSASPRAWEAGEVVTFVHNGTYWMMVGRKTQSNWSQTDASAIDFIKNKPTIPNDSNLVHISGDETITGQKGFNSPVKLNDGALIFNTSISTSQSIQLYRETNDTSTGSAKAVLGLLGPIGVGDVIIRGVDTPIEDYDAVPKSYVDAAVAGGGGGGGGGDAGNSKLFYGFCATVAATTAKVVSCTGFTSADLVHGVMVLVEFDATNSGSVGSLTLNVESTGAYPIKKIYSTSIDSLTSAGELRAGSIIPFVFTGDYWMVAGVDYNSNDLAYRVRLSEGAVLPTLDKFYRYRLLFTSADGQGLVPANTSTSTNATAARTPNTRKIDPFGSIFYYSTTTAVNAGASPSSSYVWYCNAMTLGYSFNNTGAALTLTPNKPVYVVCNPQTDGSAIIDATTPYTQALPSAEDGKIYIYLGITYSATAMMLAPYHPVYEYKAGCVRLYSSSDSNVVHKTGDETVGGQKTFTDGTNIGIGAMVSWEPDEGEIGVSLGLGSSENNVAVLGINDENGQDVIVSGVAWPNDADDAANRNYVDSRVGSVTLNGYSNQYGIQPKSLCAFSASAGGATMYMTSFTTGGGTGSKVPASNLVFPIGCKIYYYDESEAFASMTAFTNKTFYSSYRGVDGRYSAVNGGSLSLQSSSTSNVYMRVMIGSTLGFWSPFYKAGSNAEIIVTSNNLVAGDFYIHLGKTIGNTGVMFQLEDNNPLYYYDATNGLTDWATYVAKTNGGSSYIAGQGINISGNTISAETPEVTITDTGNVTATIEPNTVYSFSDPLTSLSVTLDDSPSGLKLYHFFVRNSDFSSPLTMTINCSNYVFEPSHIASSVSFTLNPRMSYEFSILLRGFTAYVKRSSFGLP